VKHLLGSPFFGYNVGDDYIIPALSKKVEVLPMTICIAAICNDGKAIVVCADREISTGYLRIDGERKIVAITKSSIMMGDGDTNIVRRISDIAVDLFSSPQYDGTGGIIRVAELIRNLYIRNHLERMEISMLKPLDYDRKEFKERGAQNIQPEIYKNLMVQIQSYESGFPFTDFLVTGVDDKGGKIFRISYSGVNSGDMIEEIRIGFRAIGSGSTHSESILSILDQKLSCTIDETKHNLYAAKKFSERAPGVGETTDMAVITSDGIIFLTKEEMDKFPKMKVVKA